MGCTGLHRVYYLFTREKLSGLWSFYGPEGGGSEQHTALSPDPFQCGFSDTTHSSRVLGKVGWRWMGSTWV